LASANRATSAHWSAPIPQINPQHRQMRPLAGQMDRFPPTSSMIGGR
jgi:hypothetical protein